MCFFKTLVWYEFFKTYINYAFLAQLDRATAF